MYRTICKNKGRVLLWLTVILFLTVFQAQAAIQGLTGSTVFNFEATSDHIITGEGNSLLIWGLRDLDTAGSRAQYPAPTLIVNQDEVITINLTNNLPVATSLVFPGNIVTTATGDSQGLLAQEAAANGGIASYQFTASEPGTYMYHSGTNPALQVDMGLIGAIIVRPSGYDDATNRIAYNHADSKYDYEVLFLHTEMDPRYHDLIDHGRMDEVDTANFHPVYWFFNGRNSPDTMLPPNVAWMPTQPYNCLPRVTPGAKILVRMIGGGRDPHPLHMHGNHFRVIARDGRLLSDPSGNGAADLAVYDFTQSVFPGQTSDAIWQWTGEKQGWDIYGTTVTATHAADCEAGDTENNETGAVGADGYHDTTWEWCADHLKPIPISLPNVSEVTLSPFYSGTPYLGAAGDLPPGEGGFNANGGFFYPWHSHAEQELTNNDIFPGGQLTFVIIEPPGTTGIE